MRLLGSTYLLLVLGAIWLWGFPSATLAYYVNVAAHPALGLAALAVGWRWLAHAWRSGGPGPALVVVHAAAAVLGLLILVVGATSGQRVLVAGHAAAGAAGALIATTAVSRYVSLLVKTVSVTESCP